MSHFSKQLFVSPCLYNNKSLCGSENRNFGENRNVSRNFLYLFDYGDEWEFKWLVCGVVTAFSGTTTASRLSIDKVAEVDATKEIYSRSLQEMWTLARENGVMLPDDFVQQNLGAISKLPAGSTSSMHQDFRKGLPLEVESLQGAAIRLSAKHGLEVPTVRTLYGLLKPFEGRTNLNSN